MEPVSAQKLPSSVSVVLEATRVELCSGSCRVPICLCSLISQPIKCGEELWYGM